MRSEAWHPAEPSRVARLGTIAALLVLPVLIWDATRHAVELGPVLLGALAVIALSSFLIVPVVATGHRGGVTTATFYVWNALAMAAATVFIVSVGGDPRRYGVLYGLVMGLAATLFPAPGQLVLQPVAALSYLVALLASDLRADQVALQLALMAILAWAPYEGCRRLQASLVAERQASDAAEHQAGLANALSGLTSLDPDELMDRIVDAVVELGFDIATIGVVRDGYLEPTRHRGFSEGREPYSIPADRGLAGRAMSERRTVAVADYLDFDGRLPDRDAVRSAIAVPLMLDDVVVGALIAARTFPRAPAAAEVESLEVLGTHAGHALGNAERFASERRTVARLTELEAMKSDFVSNVSHELRTPLTVIHGVGETLATHGESLDADRRRDLLTRLNANSERLSTMIGTLLDFSRFQAGSAEVEPEPVALVAMIDGLVRRLDPILARHDVSTAIADEAVLVDPQLFEHVIENLLGNAVRHTPPGTAVQVRAEREGEVVRVTVSDDGPGIPPEELTRLKERFYRGGSPNTRPPGGIGLGLALSEEILVAHGTTLTVRSVLGEGAEFSFVLPLAAPPGAPAPVAGGRSGLA